MNNVRPPLRDRILPWYFVPGFLVVFAVNGFFVFVATRTNSGVVTEQAYEKGLAYDSVKQKARYQAALRWKAHLQLQQGAVQLTLSDANGQPLDDAKVMLHLVRPAQSGYDFIHRLPSQGKGRYLAPITFPMKGQWDATAVIQCKQRSFQHRQRLIVQ